MGKGFKHQFFILLVFTVISTSIFAVGCGIKGPPIPPQTVIPKPVTDLTKKINQSTLILTWTIPDMGKSARYKGFVVSRSSTLLSSSACTNCPKVFEKVAQIPVVHTKQATAEEKIRFQEVLQKGYRYHYMVKGVTEKGGQSPDSNIVAFDF